VFVRDAHSLYLEMLAEVGVLGFLLLVAAFSVGLATSLNRLRQLPAESACALAAPTAAFIAFAVAAAFDWMWELTVVSVVAFACLALMVGTQPDRDGRTSGWTVRSGAVISGLVAAWFLICMQAIPYLSELRIRASQEAAARGDGAAALDAAESARAIAPWASSPWLQLALVREELGDLDDAEQAVTHARDNDPSDWRLWLVSARLETKLGRVEEARASLDRARRTNPRSPLFHPG
jgi:tetratricopeptide (TPR) repeat protein